MKQIEQLFHWYGSTTAFMYHKNHNLIPLDSIAFIGQTGQIYVLGQLFGLSTEDFEGLKQSINELYQMFGQDSFKDLVTSIENITLVLEGFDGSKRLVDTLKDITSNLDAHIKDTNNPHKVTKEQIGLGNVDNTADKDKPVPTAVTETLKSYVKFADTASDTRNGVMTSNDYTKLKGIEDRATADESITPTELNSILV